MSEKSHRCYNKYVRLETSIEQKDTKIIAKLNNAYENFKIANLLEHNTRVVNDEKSRNYQKMITFMIAMIKLQHDFSDVIFE